MPAPSRHPQRAAARPGGRGKATAWVLAHRRVVIAVWAVVLLVTLVAGYAVGWRATSGGYAVPDAGSDRVAKLLEARGSAPGKLAVLLVQRSPDNAALRVAQARVRAEVSDVPELSARRRTVTRTLADGAATLRLLGPLNWWTPKLGFSRSALRAAGPSGPRRGASQ